MRVQHLKSEHSLVKQLVKGWNKTPPTQETHNIEKIQSSLNTFPVGLKLKVQLAQNPIIRRVGGREGGWGVNWTPPEEKKTICRRRGSGFSANQGKKKKQYADEGGQGLGPTGVKKNNMPTKGVRV